MPDNFRIFCNLCGRETRHNVLQLYEQPGIDGEVIRWQIVQCAGCESVCFYEEHWIETEEDWSLVGGVPYPVRSHRKSRSFADLPAILDNIYREAIAAYNNRLFALCAGGLRALVEGICADKGVIDGPNPDGNGRCRKLNCKIEGLLERQILTDVQAHALHEHRYLGNMALHELEVPDPQALWTAIDIIELILDSLYNLAHNVNNLMQNRQRANNQQQQ